MFLEQAHYAAPTTDLRLAVRRLAYEASDAGLLSPDLACGIRRVKSHFAAFTTSTTETDRAIAPLAPVIVSV